MKGTPTTLLVLLLAITSVAVCDEYIYDDGSTKDTCDSPLVPETGENGVKYCHQPCPEGEYLVKGASLQESAGTQCIPTCNSPQIIGTDNTVATCTNPCEPGYLYSFSYYTGCYPEEDCNHKLYTRDYVNFCGCGGYIHEDGSCQTTCPPPFNIQDKGSDFRGTFFCLCNEQDQIFVGGNCLQFPCKPTQVYNSLTGECRCNCPSSTQMIGSNENKICV